jgi:four helix bundle protein
MENLLSGEDLFCLQKKTMENKTLRPLQHKSFRFGVDAYNVCSQIMKLKNEWILTRQLMRSATAVGALCSESEHEQSKLDFISKRAIARKECNESKYWIALMREVGILESSIACKLDDQAEELMRLLTAGIKTAQRNLQTSTKKGSDSK